MCFGIKIGCFSWDKSRTGTPCHSASTPPEMLPGVWLAVSCLLLPRRCCRVLVWGPGQARWSATTRWLVVGRANKPTWPVVGVRMRLVALAWSVIDFLHKISITASFDEQFTSSECPAAMRGGDCVVVADDFRYFISRGGASSLNERVLVVRIGIWRGSQNGCEYVRVCDHMAVGEGGVGP